MINVLVHNLGTTPPSLSRPQGYSQQQSSARGGGWHDWPHALSIALYEVLPKGKITCAATDQPSKKGLVIDPNKLCKYVWSFIYILSELESEALKMPSLNFVSFIFKYRKVKWSQNAQKSMVH